MKKSMSTHCPFCNIASGEAPASIVYKDANVLAFMDTHPVSIAHTLVVPCGHWETIYDIPETVLIDIFSIVKRVSLAILKAFEVEGITILQLNGRAAGQTVMHFHVHIISRFMDNSVSGVPRAKFEHHNHVRPKRDELDATARKIRENL
jgi:histidine triad (HIT) family protein